MGTGPTFQGQAVVLRTFGTGPTFQGQGFTIRVFGSGPTFQGTADDLPLPPADIAPTINKFAGRPYGETISNISKLGEALNVNLTGAGQVSLFAVPTSREVVVAYATIYCTAATAVTVEAVARIETASNILLAEQSLIGLNAVDKVWMWPFPAGKTFVSTQGATISLNIVTGATATSQTADVRLYGYLV